MVRILLPEHPTPVIERVVSIFARTVRERCDVALEDAGPLTVTLAREPGIGPEGFRIEDAADGVRIAGDDERGLVYGIGKLLHEGRYAPGRFTPGPWRGASVPAKPVRGIYFASHFHNWYHDAPLEEVERYIEELALWGVNVLSVWLDMHHYTGLDDPDAQAMLARLRAMLTAAKRIGMGTGLTTLANEAYTISPVALRAEWWAGQNGYDTAPGGHYHLEICPSKPGGPELILRWAEERLAAFADIGIDYYWIWPYDQGGCTCADCAPWGVNGFPRIAEPLARMYQRYFPQGNVLLSTWYFDLFTSGEWEGLRQAFTTPPDWVDYLMVENLGGRSDHDFAQGMPGGFPAVGFPEISMHANFPWGAYGLLAFPAHIQQLWDTNGAHLAGGFPYSEGIFEDLHKVIMAQLYWDPAKPAIEIVRDYFAAECTPEAAEELTAIVTETERALPHWLKTDGDTPRIDGGDLSNAAATFARVQAVEATLPAWAKSAWRWRILALRTRIDAELAQSGGAITPALETAFRELVTIYHAEGASLWVSPPTAEAIAASREQ
jgi:hypothetical protein